MKLAKFALTCDGEKITSLEQLKEHFNLLDVLEHYKTNTLWRWLRSRGYQNELAGIEAITATQDTEILKALCGVFGIGVDQETIAQILNQQKALSDKEQATKAQLERLINLQDQLTKQQQEYQQRLAQHQQALHSCYQQQEDNLKQMALEKIAPYTISSYLKAYSQLKARLFNVQDLESGKTILRKLFQNYTELFEIERWDIMHQLHYESRFARAYQLVLLIYVFANVSTRDLLFPLEDTGTLKYALASCAKTYCGPKFVSYVHTCNPNTITLIEGSRLNGYKLSQLIFTSKKPLEWPFYIALKHYAGKIQITNNEIIYELPAL
ncbi:hypothetical protein [Helicobacter cynogastricus]|uniref:hypothetical protein n=1 Tax=Helicobacter cynogastricus TaxID=329937 RepID=UPI000CF1C722|nr:hypothetical protein [Helicobacter cynogastricus]